MDSKHEHFSNTHMDAISDNQLAPVYDKIISSFGPFSTTVDVGCGNGISGSYIKEKTGCRLIGIDGSPYGLESCKQRRYDETYLTRDLCSDPLDMPDACADLVLCKDVLEHLLTPTFVVAEIFRILKPGGYCFAHVPNHFALWFRARFLFTANIDTQLFFPNANEWDYPHIRFYTFNGFTKLFEKAGFLLTMNYSDRAPYLFPGTRRFNWLQSSSIVRALALRYPTQFATGFTLLFQRPPQA